MQGITAKITKNFKLVSTVIFVALIAVQPLNAGAFAKKLPPPAMRTALESSVQAKRALTQLSTINYRLIKDARQRDAVHRAVNAVKALAANTSPGREAGLFAKLKLAANGLKPREDHPTGAGQKCIDDAIECDKNGLFYCDLGLIMCLTVEYEELNKPGQLPG
ncbi:MAG: hypothetical protein ABIP75_14245 [Pyrinomonadaceae bacterium]